MTPIEKVYANETLLKSYLRKFLSEFEAELESGVEKSPEILNDYIESAKFMSKEYARKGDRVEEAEILLSQLIG